jgi:hypothetical protein
MSRWYFPVLASIPLLLSFLRPAPSPEIVWWTTHALDKVRPYDSVPKDAPSRIGIHAARNEFEPFQVVLRAERQEIEAVDIEITDLHGPAGAIVSSRNNVSIYLERYIDLKLTSSVDGGAGAWPDPLIPRVDNYAHEKRNAFPFRLAKGYNQPVWVDVYVPPRTPPGMYHGEVHVTVANKTRISIPLDLEVWNFSLPSTSDLPTAFGFSGLTALRQHYGKYTTDKALADVTALYQKAALWHRITLDPSAGLAPHVSIAAGRANLRWDEYDAQIRPLMDGLIFSEDEPLHGARATSVALRPPPSVNTPEQQIQYWREVASHFRQKGWFDRMFIYLWDEPNASQYSKMTELGRTVHRADPTLRNLVTAPLHQEWSDFVDIWTPVLNCFQRKQRERDFCETTVERANYNEELARGKQLWWYQSCASHSCNGSGGEYFRGWPSYMIDHDGVRNRIMEWLTWKYDIRGELYFNVNEAFATKDPWKDVYLFGGNGDGTLFYPGRPDVIGGASHIPIESIRLKLIREGLEDYEYLAILTKLRGSAGATEKVNSFIRKIYDFDTRPETLYAVRESVAHEIVEHR